MNFIEAVREAVKEGKAIKRLSWDGEEFDNLVKYVILPTNSYPNMIAIPTKENTFFQASKGGNWNPEIEELLADDWVLSDWKQTACSRYPYSMMFTNNIVERITNGTNLIEAIKQAKAENKMIQRELWNEAGLQWYIIPDYMIKVMKKKGNDVTTDTLWSPNVEDVLAEDWIVVGVFKDI